MTDTIIHVGDIGTIFEVTIVEKDGVTPVPITSATVKKIFFKKANGTKIVKDATLVNTGSDGKMKCVGVSGDINIPGTWQMQGYIEIAGGKFYSAKTKFEVHENLFVAEET